MKKLILIFTALAAFNFSLKAEDFSAVNDDGVTLHYNILDTTARTVEVCNQFNESGDDVVYKYSGAVNIPATVSYNGNAYSVTSIGNNSFRLCTDLTSVTIPNSVISIEDGAFQVCTSIVSITIPNSVTSIGDFAFNNCTSLANITLPDNLTEIGGNEYGIGYYGIFHGCTSLTNITIPNSVKIIGMNTFVGCTSLTSITIPENVTSIGAEVFSGCTSLSTLTFNADSCANLCYHQFDECPLTNVTIGDNVKYIPSCFMYDQKNLTNITISEGVTSIGDDAFSGCTSLSTLTFNADSCADFDYNTFDDCPLTNVTIGNNVKYIPANFIEGQEGITSITIPESITSIGDGAFGGCSSLSTLTFNADSCAADYHYDYRDISVFTDCPLTNVTIGNNVKYIPAYFMYGKRALTNITIPNNVKSIGSSAFRSCTGITNITVPESVTSIGESAFRSCTGITSITVPESVTSIGYAAFEGCDNLHYLNIKNGDAEVDASVLFGNMELDTLIAPASVFKYGGGEDAYEFAYGTTNKLKYLHVNGGEIADDAFSFIGRQKNVMRTVKMGDCTNTELAAEAFNGLRLMDTLILPANLEKISYMSIANCMSLKNIEISTQITEIEDRAFENCRMLNTVTFEENGVLDRIGNWAFYNCHELDYIAIPDGVTEVGEAAFYGCTRIENISIPASMTTIEDHAFALCAKMKSMSVKAIVPPEIAAKTFENVDRTIPVYVPDGSVADYKAHLLWKEFNIIGVVVVVDTFTVTFNANGGTGTMAVQEFIADRVAVLNANGYARDGYEFLGWATTDSTGVVYADEAEYTATANIVLYAVWSANEYTLSFDVEGIEGITVAYDAAIGDLPVAERDGYTFEGWKIGDDVITAETVWNFTEDKEAVAQWEVISSIDDIESNTVNFVQNGNTLVFNEEQDVRVYTVGGICIFSGMATEVNIEQAGVYVVVTATAATKVIIP